MHSPLQINDFRWKETGLWLLKVIVLVGCMYYISRALGKQSFDEFEWQSLKDGRLWLLCSLVLLLVPLNWYMEVVKWQFCVKPLAKISKSQALWSVLRGLSLNWLIPFTLGDFIGRSLNLPKTNGTVRANLVNRFASFWITIFMFILGSFYFWPEFLMITLIGFFLIGVVLIIAIAYDQVYSISTKVKILLTAAFRYLVFSIQFALLIHHFCPEIPWITLMSGIPVVFLIRTLAPSLLGAFGVREASVIWTFSAVSDSPGNLLVASLFLWIFNLVMPSLIGLLPVLAYRFKLST